MTHQNDNNELPIVNDANWASRHNREMARRSVEEAKEREQEIARRRAEWEAIPASERVCTVCGLRLSAVDIARIAEKPMGPRHHDFCNPFDVEMNNAASGLVGLLKEVYGDDEIPLSEFEKLVTVYKSQRGRCWISRIRLSIPVEGQPPTPTKCPSSTSPLDHSRMERERQKEWAERKRSGELHIPVIFFDKDGELRLLSKTVAAWKGDLTDKEFFDLITLLHSRIPDLQKYQSMDIGTTATSRVPRRDRNRY